MPADCARFETVATSICRNREYQSRSRITPARRVGSCNSAKVPERDPLKSFCGGAASVVDSELAALAKWPTRGVASGGASPS